MGIKVVATRQGVFGKTGMDARIYNEGETFEVENEDQLGSWMVRLDGKPNKAVERIEKAREQVEKNGYAPIDASKVKATATPSKADKLAAAKKAVQLKKDAEKKQKEQDEDDKLAKELV